MKLRIRGNSVRIRVSRSELAQIVESGCAEDAVEFSPGTRLSYRVDVAPQGAVRAGLQGHQIQVILPRRDVERWLAPEQVAIRAEQAIGNGATLSILVEKDFACLTPREEEDQSDLFPNPEERSR